VALQRLGQVLRRVVVLVERGLGFYTSASTRPSIQEVSTRPDTTTSSTSGKS
jgi:hypothetical protein